MLNLSVDKFRLEHSLRAAFVDQERSRRSVPRRLGTPLAHHSSESASLSDDIVRDGEVLATGHDVAVSEMRSDDGVLGDGSMRDDGLGVVGPGRGPDVDRDLEVSGEGGDVVSSDKDRSVVSLPRWDVDEVNSYGGKREEEGQLELVSRRDEERATDLQGRCASASRWCYPELHFPCFRR